VVFDANSFSDSQNTVTLKDAVVIGSLTATDANFVFSGKKNFTVEGSINADANADFGKLRGTLVLSGNGNNTVSIVRGPEGDIVVESGDWSLASDLETEGNITINGGSFTTNGYSVTCAVFTATENKAALNIENSTVTCDKWDFRKASNLTFEAKESVILIRDEFMKNFLTVGGLHYNIAKSYALAATKGPVMTVTKTDITCPSNSDYMNNVEELYNGTITVTITGGDAEGYGMSLGKFDFSLMEYAAEPGGAAFGLTHTYYNKGPGDYNVLFSPDGTNTVFGSASIEFENPDFDINIRVTGNAECWGDDIKLSYTATGGTGSGTYTSQIWTNPGEIFPYSNAAEITAVPEKSYVVTITDGNGCKYTSPSSFTYSPAYREMGFADDYDSGPSRIVGGASPKKTCSNENTGEITVEDVTGGTGSYTYTATLGGTVYDFGSNPTKKELPEGEYTILITDGKGCTNRKNLERVFLDPEDMPEEIKVTIGVTPAPKANAGSDDKVCLKEGSYTVSKSNGVKAENYDEDGYILWTVDDPSVAEITSGADTETPTLTLHDAGTVTLTMEVKNGTCAVVQDDMTLKVVGTPKPTITSTDHSICGLKEDIQAVASMGGTLVADHIGGTGTGTVTVSNLHVEVDEPGEYIFRVIETEPENNCEGYSDSDGNGVGKTVTLNFYNQPTVSFTPDNGNTCGVTPVTVKPTIANEESISWGHNGKGNLVESADSKSATYTPSTLDADNDVIVTVTVGNGVCPSKNAAYTITVKPVPTVSINPIGAGANGDVCGLSGIIATAVPSHGGELTWDNGGDNTFSVIPASATTATLQGDNGVTYGLTVKEEKDGCLSDASPVVYVTFHANPTLSLSDSEDVCGTDPATATATATNNTSLSWSKNDAVFKGTLSQNGDASSMTATYIPAASDAGNDVTLTATVTTAACGTLTEDYTFHVYKVPSPTLTGKEICGPEDDGYLTATIESGNTVEWKIPSGVKKVEEKIEGTEAKVKLALSGTTYGDYTIGVVESNTNCISEEVTAKVTFKAKPVMEFEEYTATICAGESYTVKVKTHENYTNYIWSASDGGTIEMGTHAGTYNSVASSNGKRVTITAIPTGGCTSEGAQTMTLTVNPNPAPVINDATVCGMDYTLPTPVSSVTFDPITYPDHPSSDFAWSTPDVSGKAHVSGGKFTATEEGTYTLHLAEMVGSCQQFDEANITFVAKPTANAGADDAVCFNEPSYDLNATAENHAGLVWSSPTAGVFATDNLTPTYTFTDDDKANGSVTLTLKAKAKTPCESTDDYESKITITINPLPTPTVSGDNNICQKETGNYSTESGMSDYKWYIDDVEQSGSSNTFSHKWETAGTFNVKVEYTDGNGCKGVSLVFPVTVRDLPSSGLVSSDNTCTNGSGLILDATATGGSGSYSYAWTGNGADYLNDKTIAAPTFMSDVADTYTLTCTITDTDPDYGCSVEATITIENEQGPTVNAGPDTTICFNGTYKLEKGVEFANGTTIEWTTDGDGSFDDATDINATYKPGDADKLNGEVHLTLTVNSANCGSISDQMTLSIMPELTIGIGTLKPFSIASSTKISVEIVGSYPKSFGLQFYLVAPDGTHEVKLYDGTDHGSTLRPWRSQAGNFDFEFTTESNVDFYNTMKGWGFGDDVNGTFGASGDWSDIYGLNPAEGGWAVRVGSSTVDGVGQLVRAIIKFTDVNYQGNTQTLTFDSKVLSPAVSIPNMHTISYISPVGLRESCYGKCDAHAVAKAIGGSGKIVKWEWARDINFTEEYYVGGTYDTDTLDLCRGIYYVRVTDAKGCEAVTMVEVGSPDQIHINKDATTDVTCFSGSDGTVTFSATKEMISHFDFDVAGYTATTFTDFSASFTTLPFGDAYRVIVTDEDGCQDSLDFQIGEPNKLVITKIDSTLATSCQVDNGSVTFTVTGGAVEGDYHIEYMGLPQDQPNIVINQATLTATNLAGASGIRFRIYDAATYNPLDLDEGCFVDTTVSTVAEGMELDIAKTENACNGADEASITVTVSKGSGDYTYEWYDENNNLLAYTTGIASGLSEGTYTVKVTDNNTLCDVTSDPITIVDPEKIRFAAPVFTEAIKCYGDETASFTVEVSGGTDGLNYSWNIGDNTTNGLTAVGAGTYVLTATDGNFCSKDTTIVISAPESALVIVNDTVITTESECNIPTGTATVQVEGGYGAYTYEWTSMSDASIVVDPNAMAADFYTLVVKDELGCSVEKTFEVLDNGSLKIKMSNIEGVKCRDDHTGSAQIGSVKDANGDSYNHADLWIWWNGVQTDLDYNNELGRGVNIVRVKSKLDGCSRTDTFNVGDENALRVSISRKPDFGGDGSCDGSIRVKASGGYADNYTYEWSYSDGTVFNNTDNSVDALCEGDYHLYVTDGGSPLMCTIDTLIHIDHRPVTWDEDLTQVSSTLCYNGDDGAITLMAKDGYYDELYYFEWTSELWPSDYVLTTGPDLTSTVTNLKSGKYSFKIWQRDTIVQKPAKGSIFVGQPSDSLFAEPDINGSHCYDAIGEISITKTIGGTAPFTYTFSKDDWTKETTSIDGQTSVDGLTAGNYNMYVRDANGCEYNKELEVGDLSKFIIELNPFEPWCNGQSTGEIEIIATSNNGTEFSYEWVGRKETTNRLSGIPAGVYTVKVTDAMNCVKIDSVEVKDREKVNFSIVNTKPGDCFNTSDAEVVIDTIMGDTGSKVKFIFTADNGDKYYDSTMQMSRNTFMLSAGEYEVLAYDANGCPSDKVALSVASKRGKITLDTIEHIEPLCYMYDSKGNLSYGSITIKASGQVSSTMTDVYIQIDGGNAQSTSMFSTKFDKMTAGYHTITIGYGDSLICPVVILDTLNSTNNLKADAFFKNGAKATFTCPDNELTAYVTAQKSFSYKFYTLTDEDAEKLEIANPAPKPAQPEVVPVDNTTTNDTVNTTDTTPAAAYRFHRGIYFRADSLPADSTNEVVPPVDLPTYDHATSLGREVTMFAQGVAGSNNEAWVDNFKPYGRETFYYFEVNDNVCISVDSIKATSLRPVDKLQAVVAMEDATSDELFIAGEYEVPEGGELILSANQLEFEFSDNIYAFADNGWLWQSAPLDGNGGTGLSIVNTSSTSWNENPLVAQGYGRFVAKVWDSVRFELSDDTQGVYQISDTALTCSYYDSVIVNSISGIKPMQVFTPNGDGKNDTWGIDGLASYDKATIYVFNRWGGRVWQYSGTGKEYSANEWNGRNEKNKPVPSGTYYYVIQCSDGVLGGKKVTGPVTVIR
jgi:gliding motility-associated-like protein